MQVLNKFTTAAAALGLLFGTAAIVLGNHGGQDRPRDDAGSA